MFPIVELRQYTLHPGQRDVLIDLFEREFIESQEALGMKVIGTFRDLERPDRFVWIRGFRDMPSRAEQLTAFYTGPVWQAHREAANATMIDSDNVLLLHGSDASERRKRAAGERHDRDSPRTDRREHLFIRRPVGEDFIDFFRTVIEPQLRREGIAVRGSYVTETSPNNFPRLPVRENEQVFVWFSTFESVEDYRRSLAALAESRGWQAVSAVLQRKVEGAPEVLLLQPTARSR